MKLIVAAMLSAMALTACASGGGESADSSEAAAPSGGGAGTVTVDDFSFDPETTEAKVGDEVTWTVAEGSSAHTVKFDDEESESLDAGASYSRSFDKAGEYKYVCGIHPQMTGTVAVE